jgi:hypothetical protein
MMTKYMIDSAVLDLLRKYKEGDYDGLNKGRMVYVQNLPTSVRWLYSVL